MTNEEQRLLEEALASLRAFRREPVDSKLGLYHVIRACAIIVDVLEHEKDARILRGKWKRRIEYEAQKKERVLLV